MFEYFILICHGDNFELIPAFCFHNNSFLAQGYVGKKDGRLVITCPAKCKTLDTPLQDHFSLYKEGSKLYADLGDRSKAKGSSCSPLFDVPLLLGNESGIRLGMYVDNFLLHLLTPISCIKFPFGEEKEN